MKKYGFMGILGLTVELTAAVFLALCIFTDWNDDVFLPVALCCTCVGSAISLIMQLKARKKGK